MNLSADREQRAGLDHAQGGAERSGSRDRHANEHVRRPRPRRRAARRRAAAASPRRRRWRAPRRRARHSPRPTRRRGGRGGSRCSSPPGVPISAIAVPRYGWTSTVGLEELLECVRVDDEERRVEQRRTRDRHQLEHRLVGEDVEHRCRGRPTWSPTASPRRCVASTASICGGVEGANRRRRAVAEHRELSAAPERTQRRDPFRVRFGRRRPRRSRGRSRSRPSSGPATTSGRPPRRR